MRLLSAECQYYKGHDDTNPHQGGYVSAVWISHEVESMAWNLGNQVQG